MITAAARALRDSRRLVVLTGAGISKESGIPTFRDAMDGLWARYDPHQLATPEAFERNPKLVWDWYEYRREMVRQAGPNPGHRAIVDLETYLPHVVVVTQNTDGIHQLCGSSDVITLHGSMLSNRCSRNCQGDPTLIDVDDLVWDRDSGPPRCPHCGAWVRPAVVWFGESLPPAALERAFDLSNQADVMLVVGTSGVVQPAANLPFLARRQGAVIIEVNPSRTPITAIADWHLAGPSGQILPQVIAALAEISHA
ncbi:MAG: NAD-dependent deacylase [Anaerolineae bacterium]|nr:NAD-dependent deacylase [Anaerolineae bacterium]